MGGELICEARCPSCPVVTLFRLDLRITGLVGGKVYRIPDLGYAESVEDGVGLVLNRGRITSRSFYGPRACICELVDTIEIL